MGAAVAPLSAVALASGRGSNFAALADAVRAGTMPIAFRLLVTDNPDAGALAVAEEHSVPTAVVNRKDYPDRAAFDNALVNAVVGAGAELVCLAGFMRILSPTFLKGVGCPVVNIHPALLPSFPGLHAQKQAIDYGVKISGATVHFVDEGVDTGPIILQAAVPVEDDDTEASLAARILAEEHRIYAEAIRRIVVEGRIVQRRSPR